MGFSTLKLVGGPLPPGAGHVRPPAIVTFKRVLPLKVRSQEEQKLQAPKTFTVSRRDTMLSLTTASLSGIAFFSTEPIEARIVKPEIRKKIREKLEMLREKAGVSKPKSEDREKTPPPEPLAKENMLPLPPPPPPLPNPQ